MIQVAVQMDTFGNALFTVSFEKWVFRKVGVWQPIAWFVASRVKGSPRGIDSSRAAVDFVGIGSLNLPAQSGSLENEPNCGAFASL